MIKNNKGTLVIFHLLAWAVLFSLPYLLSSGQDQLVTRVLAHSWVPLIFYAILFYLNYLYLVKRFLFNRRTLLFIVVNLLVIIVFVFIRGDINDLFFKDFFRARDDNAPPQKLFIYIQAVSYMLPVVCAIAIRTLERWKRAEAERKEAANVKLQSELQHLRYQLQPHFFFNSLNNIYSLVDISPDQAKATIHSLGKLMRYLLYETKSEMVPLSKEIEFLKKYIELMQLRLSDKTTVKVSFPNNTETLNIAPLLFISLIENAFKHGVSASEASEITMEMKLIGNTIAFHISNKNFPKNDLDKSGSGIGLENLEKRLQLLYPHGHSFKQWIDDNRYYCELKIEI